MGPTGTPPHKMEQRGDPPQNRGDGGEGPPPKSGAEGFPSEIERRLPKVWGGTLPKWLQGSEGPLPKMGVMAVRDAPKWPLRSAGLALKMAERPQNLLEGR